MQSDKCLVLTAWELHSPLHSSPHCRNITFSLTQPFIFILQFPRHLLLENLVLKGFTQNKQRATWLHYKTKLQLATLCLASLYKGLKKRQINLPKETTQKLHFLMGSYKTKPLTGRVSIKMQSDCSAGYLGMHLGYCRL